MPDFYLIRHGSNDLIGKSLAGRLPKVHLNEQGKMLPRRITGNSLKYQRKVSDAIKKARQMSLLPYVTDLLK